MKKIVLAAMATAAISTASAEGLAVGFDHSLAGISGISAKLDAKALMIQGIVGFDYTSTEDKSDALNFSVRGFAPMGARGPLSLYGGVGLSLVDKNDSSAKNTNENRFLFEVPFVAQYKFTENFAVSTQAGLVMDFQDDFKMRTSGDLFGNAGFHVLF